MAPHQPHQHSLGRPINQSSCSDVASRAGLLSESQVSLFCSEDFWILGQLCSHSFVLPTPAYSRVLCKQKPFFPQPLFFNGFVGWFCFLEEIQGWCRYCEWNVLLLFFNLWIKQLIEAHVICVTSDSLCENNLPRSCYAFASIMLGKAVCHW